MRLILASQSTARQTLLANAGVPFSAVSSEIDETIEKNKLIQDKRDPQGIALALARLKAQNVAKGRTHSFVLGCDQTLSLADGTMLDKPGSRAQLTQQLAQLSGASHQLHSAAVIVEGDAVVWQALETVTLTMRPFSHDFIEHYSATASPDVLGCVGGYQIEGVGVQLFSVIEGSYHAVLGLPLLPLLYFLRERGFLAA